MSYVYRNKILSKYIDLNMFREETNERTNVPDIILGIAYTVRISQMSSGTLDVFLQLH